MTAAFRAFNATKGLRIDDVLEQGGTTSGGVRFNVLPDGSAGNAKAGQVASRTGPSFATPQPMNPHQALRDYMQQKDSLKLTALDLACINAPSNAGSDAAQLLWQARMSTQLGQSCQPTKINCIAQAQYSRGAMFSAGQQASSPPLEEICFTTRGGSIRKPTPAPVSKKSAGNTPATPTAPSPENNTGGWDGPVQVRHHWHAPVTLLPRQLQYASVFAGFGGCCSCY